MQILIPVDDTPYTIAALHSVEQRTWPRDTKIVLSRVIEDSSVHGDRDVRTVGSEQALLAADAYESLKDTEKWIEDLADSLEIDNCEINTKLLMGDVVEQITNLANEGSIDYIVMGSHERAPSVRNFLDSVASGIIDQVNCSVEIVRPRRLHKMVREPDFDVDEVSRFDYAPKRIVLATDFSKNSLAAMDWLATLDCPSSLEVALITAEPPVSMDVIELEVRGEMNATVTTTIDSGSIELKLKEQSEKLEYLSNAKLADARVLKGDPAERILEYSKDWQADLIVVGAHGVSNSFELMMGSTTRSVMDGSDSSVVAINARNWSKVAYEWKRK